YELGLGVCAAVIGGAWYAVTLPALRHTPARFAILAVIPVMLAALHPRVFKPLTDWVFGKLGRESLPKPLPYRAVLLLLPAYLVGWLLAGTGLFLFALGLHDVPASKLPTIAAAYPVAFGASVLTFVIPSGLGTRDAILATALKRALHALTLATAIAVAFRIFQTAVELTYVGAVTLLARRARSLS